MEINIVKASLAFPGWLTKTQVHRLRYAVNLAKITEVRASDGRDIDLEENVAVFRQRIVDTLGPLLGWRQSKVERPELASLVPFIWELCLEAREQLRKVSATRLPFEDIEEEIRRKKLVLVCGGGGGVGYVYLGAFHAFEERGLTPSLISGTSIGAILGAFRARHRRFDAAQAVEVVQRLSWSKLFSPLSLRTRYGLPGPLRLSLRSGIGDHLQGTHDRPPLRVEDLEIPLLITIAGIRRGALPHDPEWYEHGAQSGRIAGIARTRRLVSGLWRTLSDFVMHPEVLKPLLIGADPLSAQLDLLDVLGFSSAVPGLIHYDIARDAPDDIAHLEEVLEREDVVRMIDGGLVDNVPARAAWRTVQGGRIGGRNALIVAMDAFAPKLSAPLWIPIQRLAQQNVRPNLKYAHVTLSFLKTLSPIDLVPSVSHLLNAARNGRDELMLELPLIERLMEPLDPELEKEPQ